MSEVLPEAPARLTTVTRTQVALALGLASLLRTRPPDSIRHLLTKVATGARPASYQATKLARDQILTASSRCRGGNACLLRSIAVALLCRWRGIWPTWVVGVLAVPPFAAHAWVEADGRIVDEPLGETDYRALFRVRPVTRSAPQPTENTTTSGEEV